MPHVLGHTPPPPPATSNGLPPALPGDRPAPVSGMLALANPAQSNPARRGVSLLLGALVGGAVGFLVGGPVAAVAGAALGAGAVLLVNHRRGGS